MRCFLASRRGSCGLVALQARILNFHYPQETGPLPLLRRRLAGPPISVTFCRCGPLGRARSADAREA